MLSEALDAVDAKILDLIQHDAGLSVAEIAEQIGRPGAARAVGLANGRNPICRSVFSPSRGERVGVASGRPGRSRMLS